MSRAQKKILIVCRYFAPQSVMGAIRPTKIAKYLATDHSFQVSVACEKGPFPSQDPLLQADRVHICDFIEVRDALWVRLLLKISRFLQRKKGAAGTQWSAQSNTLTFLQKIHGNGMVLLEWAKERAFAKKIVREIKRKNLSFDAVFSSYGPLCGAYAAIELKKKSPSIAWIADFRDPPFTQNSPLMLLQKRSRQLTKNVFRHASSITVTTKGICADMGWPQDARIQLVSNGYDPADTVSACGFSKEQFHLVYTGVFYGEHRNLSLIFRALQELIFEKKLYETKLCLHYAGPDSSALQLDAEKYALHSILKNHGQLPRKQALELQKSADVLLLSSWSKKGDMQDIIPGKLYEYMLANRPVVAVVNGDVASTTLCCRIREANLGICCEEAAGKADFDALKIYLKRQYDACFGKETEMFSPNKEILAQFQYPQIAAKISALCELNISLP